jgi:ketosteroid isomerase-like protein
MNEQLAQDHFAIRQLANAYSHAVMRRDAAAAAEVYLEDGVLSAFYAPDIVGRMAIAGVLHAALEPLDFITQTCAAEMVSVEGDTALATWTVTEWLRFRDRSELACCFGAYEDRLVRMSYGWRFERRRFVPFYRGTVPSESL